MSVASIAASSNNNSRGGGGKKRKRLEIRDVLANPRQTTYVARRNSSSSSSSSSNSGSGSRLSVAPPLPGGVGSFSDGSAFDPEGALFSAAGRPRKLKQQIALLAGGISSEIHRLQVELKGGDDSIGAVGGGATQAASSSSSSINKKEPRPVPEKLPECKRCMLRYGGAKTKSKHTRILGQCEEAGKGHHMLRVQRDRRQKLAKVKVEASSGG